jgi:tetratricopeptide (TPR) repeat protein
VVSLVTGAWANTFAVPLLFDDEPSLVQNASLRSLSPEVLTPPRETTLAGRPFSNLTFALNHAATGLRLGPLHATNLALHFLAALVLMALVLRTLQLPHLRDRYEGRAEALALLASLLWALHPVQTESVTYVVQRVESLAGLFLLLTLYAALRASEAVRPFAWSAIAVLACGLGMASKETMAVAPVVLVLYDRAFLFPSWRESLQRRAALYLGLASTWGVLALQVITAPRAKSAGFGFARFGPLDYLGIQVRAIPHYLRLLVWPSGLTFDYGEPGSAVPLAQSLADWAPALFLLALLGASVWLWIRHRPAGFLALAFFVLLAPSSSVVPIATEVIAEHRLYLPSAAFLLLGLFGLDALLRRRDLLTLGAGSGVLAFGLLTSHRNADYRTAISLWEDTTQKAPNNARAWAELGDAYRAAGQIDQARQAYESALQRDSHLGALQHLGLLEEKAGRCDLAIGHYEQYLARRDAAPDVHFNLAHCMEQQRRPDEALRHFRSAVSLAPDDAAMQVDLANLLARLGRNDEALAAYQQALKAQPQWAPGHYNYGVYLVRRHQLADALEELQRAQTLDPTLGVAFHRGGLVASWLNQPAVAVGMLSRAVALEPTNMEPRLDLAWLLATNPDEHMRNGVLALNLARHVPSQSARSLDVLAAAQAETGDFALAATTEAQAIALGGAKVDAMEQHRARYLSGAAWREAPTPP